MVRLSPNGAQELHGMSMRVEEKVGGSMHYAKLQVSTDMPSLFQNGCGPEDVHDTSGRRVSERTDPQARAFASSCILREPRYSPARLLLGRLMHVLCSYCAGPQDTVPWGRSVGTRSATRQRQDSGAACSRTRAPTKSAHRQAEHKPTPRRDRSNTVLLAQCATLRKTAQQMPGGSHRRVLAHNSKAKSTLEMPRALRSRTHLLRCASP